VNITTATTNGAGTSGTVSIKFSGTNGESKLYSFRKGFTKGWVNTKTFKFPSIGNLTQVYLELDTPEDQWRFSTISIKYNDYILYTFNKSYALNQNLPSVWLKCNLSFFIFFFFSIFLFSMNQQNINHNHN